MKKVFLIGYMGVGKSTLGKRLANALGLPFYDLDREIEKTESLSINEIFAKKGELHFREMESRLLKDFCFRRQPFVLATGGGAALLKGNMDTMKDAGLTLWLDMPMETVLSRLAHSEDRPLLKNVPPANRKDFVETHFAERLPHYRTADMRFESSNVNAERLAGLVADIQSR